MKLLLSFNSQKKVAAVKFPIQQVENDSIFLGCAVDLTSLSANACRVAEENLIRDNIA